MLVPIFRAFRSIVKHFEKELHLKLVEEVPDDYKEDYFLNCHLFGKSALGEDVFVSMSLFAGEMTTITFHVRSKDKALINIMHSQIKQTFATNYLPKEDS